MHRREKEMPLRKRKKTAARKRKSEGEADTAENQPAEKKKREIRKRD